MIHMPAALKREHIITFTNNPKIQKDGKSRNQVSFAKVDKDYVQYKADAFRNVEDINKMVISMMNKNSTKTHAVLFILGINIGCRCGDILTFRTRDVTDDEGNIIDGIVLEEQKTGKPRMIYFNDAVKTVLEWHIKNQNLKPDDYLFTGTSPRAKYLDEFTYDDEGNVIGMTLTKEKYYYVGENKYQRSLAPVARRSASDWIKNGAIECGIPGHYSSHCMRKTFAHFIGIDWTDEYNTLAVQKALGHAYMETTTEHYLTVDDQELREKWLNLNLGLEAFVGCINK